MGLVDLRTDLKSIKFGKDLVGGGNSNQPYVVKDIPSSFQDVGRTGGPDFLLRGGTLFPKAIVNDVSRMTQMLFDFRSPNGPLFIAKQNALSLSNVNTNTGYIKYKNEPDNTPAGDPLSAIGQFIADNLALNQGIYTPLSTIASVIGTGVGVHPNKQGLNPFNPMLGGEPGDVQTQPKGLTLPTYKKQMNELRPVAPYIYLTIGDMFNNTPGYFDSIAISTEENYTWEIDEGLQIPMMFNVSVNFVYIGKYLPHTLGKHYDVPHLTDTGVSTGNYGTFGTQDPRDESPTSDRPPIDDKQYNWSNGVVNTQGGA